MPSTLKLTPLNDEHVELGGKMVPFAGYSMPVQYPTGIKAEHAAVREAAGLFDVSHMGEFIVRGPQALDLVQRISVNDASKIEIGQAQYSAMCMETGCVIDDLIIYEPVGLNAEMTSLTFPIDISLGSVVNISGVITNTGTDVIESFDIVWSQGSSMSYSQSYDNLNISTGNSFNFTHQDQFVAQSAGLYPIDVTVTNVNGQQDEDLTNNSLTNSIMVIEYGEINSGQFQREYIYFKPSSAPENCPLVFVCHGYTGTAQGIMNYSDFNNLATEYGFAVCYPQGIEDSGGNTFFNVGYDFQNNETVDDVAFLEDLITLFSADNSINPDKVFCTGMSNGGDFCYLLACEASESFLGVAPIAGMIMQDIMDDCNPSQNVGILEIHGTQDNVTYYNGDVNNQDGWGAYPSIPATIDFFVDMYDLELNSTGNFPNISNNDGSTVSYEKYGVDEECAKVWLYTVNGGGHDWPGAYGNMDIDSSREAWLFFESLCESPVAIEKPNAVGDKTLEKITDLLGREVSEIAPQILLYIYDDGSIEKKFVVE